MEIVDYDHHFEMVSYLSSIFNSTYDFLIMEAKSFFELINYSKIKMISFLAKMLHIYF